MSKTYQVTVNAAGQTQITAQTQCSEVTVQENIGIGTYPTSDFLVFKPNAAATGIRKQGGSAYTFKSDSGGWLPGDVIGFLQLVSGSTTFDVDESLK